MGNVELAYIVCCFIMLKINYEFSLDEIHEDNLARRAGYSCYGDE